MTCKGCGNRIPEKYLRLEAFRCPYCGKLYRRIASRTVSNPSGKASPGQKGHGSAGSGSHQSSFPKKRSLLNNKKLIFAGGGVLLLIIVVVLIVSLSNRGSSPTPDYVSPIQIATTTNAPTTAETIDHATITPTTLISTPTSAPRASSFPMTIYSDYGITITVESADVCILDNATWGWKIPLEFENTNEFEVRFSCGDVCTEGEIIYTYLPQVQIAGNSNARDSLVLYDVNIEMAGIDSFLLLSELTLSNCEVTRLDTYNHSGKFDITFPVR